MPQPMLCLDEDVCHGAKRFDAVFSKPHSQSLVTVLLGRMECDGTRTLSGWRHEVGQTRSLRGLSRCVSEAPWSPEAVATGWLTHVCAELQPHVHHHCEQMRKAQPKRRGRPKEPLVTGSLSGDDSTMSTPKGRTMHGWGTHHATTSDQRIRGQSVVQGRAVLLDRRCPLAPHRSRQEKVCQAEEGTFHRTIERMETLIRECEPVAGTRTPILLDRWDSATCLWHAARERDVLITTGLTSHRWLRVPDATVANGWRWQQVSEDAAGVRAQDGDLLPWPRGGPKVSVHVVQTSGRTLARCQVGLVRHDLTAPLTQTRSWASRDLEAHAEGLLTQIAARWDIEVCFGESNEELGLDHSHVMSASALLRLWTLALLASVFREEEHRMTSPLVLLVNGLSTPCEQCRHSLWAITVCSNSLQRWLLVRPVHSGLQCTSRWSLEDFHACRSYRQCVRVVRRHREYLRAGPDRARKIMHRARLQHCLDQPDDAMLSTRAVSL